MVGVEDVKAFVGGVGEDVQQFVTERPVTSAGIGVGVLAASGLVVAGLKGAGVSKGRRKTKKKTSKGRKRDRKFRSKQKHELAYVKRKRRLGKKITRPRYKSRSTRTTRKRVGKTYFTKKGQPYKIMSSGKAKFIKKKRR